MIINAYLSQGRKNVQYRIYRRWLPSRLYQQWCPFLQAVWLSRTPRKVTDKMALSEFHLEWTTTRHLLRFPTIPPLLSTVTSGTKHQGIPAIRYMMHWYKGMGSPLMKRVERNRSGHDDHALPSREFGSNTPFVYGEHYMPQCVPGRCHGCLFTPPRHRARHWARALFATPIKEPQNWHQFDSSSFEMYPGAEIGAPMMMEENKLDLRLVGPSFGKHHL